MNTKIKSLLSLILAAMIFGCLYVPNVTAAWGDFDKGFGFQGALYELLTDHYPKKVAFQSDGKILVTGYRALSTGYRRLFLRRYLPSGQIDTSFGDNGSAIIYKLTINTIDDQGEDIAVFPNGQIAVGGVNKDNLPTIWKFNSDGRLDSDFGYRGVRVLNEPTYGNNIKIAVQNTNLVVGYSKDVPNSGLRIVVVRLTSRGSNDPRFGTLDEAVTSIVGLFPFSLLVENETGNITISGHDAGSYRIGLERLLANGQRDTNFVFANVSAQGYGFHKFIRLLSQKYVFWFAEIPSFVNNYTPSYKLLKLDTNGAKESIVTYLTGSDSGSNCPSMLFQQQDGKVITNSPGKMYRFDSEINPDSTETKLCSNFSRMTHKTSAEMQADDKIVTAGRFSNGGNLMLVRILTN